jgi:hypothetical protein
MKIFLNFLNPVDDAEEVRKDHNYREHCSQKLSREIRFYSAIEVYILHFALRCTTDNSGNSKYACMH